MDEHQEAVDFLKLLENADRYLDAPPSPSYSPTNYSPTRATTPNTENQSVDGHVLSLERIVRMLSAQLQEQKESIKKIQQQHERRHLRLVKCITELQAATYHRKRPLESHKEEPAKRQQKETDPFELSDLRLLQQVLHAPAPPPPPLESVSVREQRIKELIGQFLRSWNRNYRCGHFMRDTCKFSESSCFRIHDKTSHSIIAREVRIVLQNAGDARLSPFFSGLIANTEKNNYRYGDTISELQKELDTLSQKLYD